MKWTPWALVWTVALAGVSGSLAESVLSDIANRRGDQTYLILDKARGVIVLFFNGAPVYEGAALTGQYPVDVLPPGLTERPFTTPAKLQEKVTPAGRFMPSPGPCSRSTAERICSARRALPSRLLR